MENKLSQINVWIGNLGKYNEGELVGEWAELPMTEKELTRFLHDQVQIGQLDDFGFPYEEYAIFDAEVIGPAADLGLKIGEYCSIEELNALAAIIDDAKPYQIEQASFAISAYDLDSDFLTAANMILQADKIECMEYNPDDPTGIAEAYINMAGGDVKTALSREALEDYFDYDSYGGELEQDYCIDGDVALDTINSNIDSSRYETEEILDEYPDFQDVLDAEKAGASFGEIRDAIADEFLITGPEYDRFAAYCDYDSIWSAEEIANIAMQLDEIYGLELPHNSNLTDNERLAYEYIDQVYGGDASSLPTEDLIQHFDMQKYNEMLESYVSCANGYFAFSDAFCPSEDFYSREEVMEIAEDLIEPTSISSDTTGKNLTRERTARSILEDARESAIATESSSRQEALQPDRDFTKADDIQR